MDDDGTQKMQDQRIPVTIDIPPPILRPQDSHDPLSRIASALERIAAAMERTMEMDNAATGGHT